MGRRNKDRAALELKSGVKPTTAASRGAPRATRNCVSATISDGVSTAACPALFSSTAQHSFVNLAWATSHGFRAVKLETPITTSASIAQFVLTHSLDVTLCLPGFSEAITLLAGPVREGLELVLGVPFHVDHEVSIDMGGQTVALRSLASPQSPPVTIAMCDETRWTMCLI